MVRKWCSFEPTQRSNESPSVLLTESMTFARSFTAMACGTFLCTMESSRAWIRISTSPSPAIAGAASPSGLLPFLDGSCLKRHLLPNLHSPLFAQLRQSGFEPALALWSSALRRLTSLGVVVALAFVVASAAPLRLFLGGGERFCQGTCGEVQVIAFSVAALVQTKERHVSPFGRFDRCCCSAFEWRRRREFPRES